MKANYFLLMAASALLAVTACDKDDPEPQPNPEPEPPVVVPDDPKPEPPAVTLDDIALSGIVYDTNGNPLSGVSVTTGSLSATTAADGTFSFTQAAVADGRALVTFKKSGYFSLTRSGDKQTEMSMSVVLRSKGNTNNSSQTSFDASEARQLTAGGMKADIPAASVVDANGEAYSGSVTADMLYLSPSDADFNDAMPGGDLAAVRTDESTAQLLSYGMTEVSLTDASGNPLQLKEGAEAELTFPIPDDMKANPPATIPLWYFDEAKGVWVEEGTATLQGDVYVGKVGHFSWHNLDVPSERVTIRGQVTDCEGRPVRYTKISVEQTAAVTNSEGRYTVYVPANTPVTVTVKSKDYNNYLPEVSHEVGGQSGGQVLTQDIELPCTNTPEEPLPPVEGATFNREGATVKYIMDGSEAIFTFDNYGQRVRWDLMPGTDDHTVLIIDNISKTYTIAADGFWMPMPYTGNEMYAYLSFLMWDPALYGAAGNASGTETIAGVSCSIYTGTDYDGCSYKIGIWNGLLLLTESCEGVILAATEVSTEVPDNAFTQTMDIF